MNIARYLTACIGKKITSPRIYLVKLYYDYQPDESDDVVTDYCDIFVKADSGSAAKLAAEYVAQNMVIYGTLIRTKNADIKEVPHRRIWSAEASGDQVGEMGEIFK